MAAAPIAARASPAYSRRPKRSEGESGPTHYSPPASASVRPENPSRDITSGAISARLYTQRNSPPHCAPSLPALSLSVCNPNPMTDHLQHSSAQFASQVKTDSPRYERNQKAMAELVAQVRNEEELIRQGGGEKAIAAQHKKGRLTARERIALLIDGGTEFFELGSYASWGMYEEWGGAPSAGVVTGLAHVQGRLFMLVVNDATVKAGAFFPMTAKKVIRAQNIAIDNHIPTIYLVDSAGVFLPLQEDVFPDTDDFGRVFRNNAVMSAMGIPQIAAIMGMCVAGGAYLPVMCDHILMTDGSGLFLAGPALVQAAIGQKVSAEDLGGAAMHAGISGTVDFREPDDPACLARIRSIVEKWGYRRQSPWDRKKPVEPALAAEEIYGIYDSSTARTYDKKEILTRVLDDSRFD